MSWLLALLTSLLFGLQPTDQAKPAIDTTPINSNAEFIPESTPVALPAPAPAPTPLPVSVRATVNDAACPLIYVQTADVSAIDGSAQAYPICMHPMTDTVWACTSYFPDGTWRNEALAVDPITGYPLSTTCGSDGRGDISRVDANAISE